MISATHEFERFPIEGRPGYFLDSYGYEFFSGEEADPQAIRRRLVELIGEPCAASPPLVIRAVAIGGELPTREQIRAVEAEMAKAPSRLVDDFKARGGIIEIVPGLNASLHPLTAHNYAARSCGGWFSYRRNLVCIAGETDRLATLHELGHAWDRFDGASGRFSNLPLWRRICGPGLWERRFDSPTEKFAESIALFYHSPATRNRLSDALQEFIERICS